MQPQQGALQASWTSLERMLDAEVVLVPVAAGAGRNDPMNPPRTEGGDVRDANAKGEIEEIAIDARSGEIRWVVIDTGDLLDDERKVVVPFSKLKPRATAEADELAFELHLDRAVLMRLPAFDLDRAREGSIDQALANIESAWNEMKREVGEAAEEVGERVRDGNGDHKVARDASAERGQAAMVGPKFVFAGKLSGMDVKTSSVDDDGFGEVSKVLIDTRHGRVDYVVTSKGGVLGIGETDYLIPFRAARVVAEPGDDEQVLKVMKSTAEMESAVRYKSPEGEGKVLDVIIAQRANEFFGVKPAASKGPMHKDGMKPDDARRDPGQPDRNRPEGGQPPSSGGGMGGRSGG